MDGCAFVIRVYFDIPELDRIQDRITSLRNLYGFPMQIGGDDDRYVLAPVRGVDVDHFRPGKEIPV